MEKRIIMLVGGAGAGKSTWIKNHTQFFGKNFKIVSRDEIRFSLLKEGEDYFSHEKEVFRQYVTDIAEGLAAYDCVIADATHLNNFSRRKLISALGKALKNVNLEAVVINTSLEDALAQNELRKNTIKYVPRESIKNMFLSFTMPELEEGFDRIYIYNAKAETKYIIKERNK